IDTRHLVCTSIIGTLREKDRYLRARGGLLSHSGLRARSRLYELVADCIAYQCSGGGEIELVHNSGPMCLHRFEAQPENACNLLVGVPLRDYLDDLALPRREKGRASGFFEKGSK